MPVPAHPSTVSVALVAVHETSAAVLYGLHEVFASVGHTWQAIAGPRTYTPPMPPEIVARSTKPFRTTLNVPISPDRSFDEVDVADIIVVADMALDDVPDPRGHWPDETAWLRDQYERGATVCSVCTGAIMLADAGLLDGRDATTHWSAKSLMQECYPRVMLRIERVLSPGGREHRVVTGGGSASWSDLALYLIARFSSKDEARRIAKVFLFGDRQNGQMPFAAMAIPKQHDDAVIADSQAWVASHYATTNPVERLAERSGLAGRTFVRRFKTATGYTPLAYVQTLRIEEAKQMLESTPDPIDDIAIAVGYDDPNSFRRLFKRSTGISPRTYRQRFQNVAEASTA